MNLRDFDLRRLLNEILQHVVTKTDSSTQSFTNIYQLVLVKKCKYLKTETWYVLLSFLFCHLLLDKWRMLIDTVSRVSLDRGITDQENGTKQFLVLVVLDIGTKCKLWKHTFVKFIQGQESKIQN